MRQSSPSAIWGNLEVSLRRWGEHRVVGGARGCGRGGVVQRCASAPVSMAAGMGLGWALRLQGGQGERAGSRHLFASHTSAPSCIYLSSGLRTWGVSIWMVRKWEQQCRSSSHFPQGSLLLLSISPKWMPVLTSLRADSKVGYITRGQKNALWRKI